MRKSLMTGHGDTVVLGIRIRLLVVWTLEAYHYRFRYLFLFLSFVLRLFSFLSAPLPRLASTPHKTRTVFILVSTDSSKGNTVCALEKELESKDRSSGGRSKIRRVTKGKSGSKARKGTGMPKVEHVGDELSERECLEQVAHVGIASSNKLEAVGELVQTEKNSHTSRHFGDFRKVRSWLEPSIFEHFCRGSSSLSGSAPVFLLRDQPQGPRTRRTEMKKSARPVSVRVL